MWIFVKILFLIVIVETKEVSSCFRAAVLDHVQQTDPANPGDAAHNLELNLKVYEDATAYAKKKGADIVVFPENGLVYQLTRSKADNFAEDIPIPNSNRTLCSHDNKTVINRLSCLAAKHSIFIAANFLDRQTCDEHQTPKCPADRKFLFNTAILFDRKGTLIGKYHKMHLFGEMALNVPPKQELVVIETELGRLGMQICFDMIFDKPGHWLAQHNLVDTMLFPTWWFDEAPFLSSSQYQMAWAFGNNVTVLASNIHKIELGSRGSGIYVGPKRQFISAIYDDAVERLLLANVPINPRFDHVDCPLNPEIVIIPQQIPEQKMIKYHHQNLNKSGTELIELPKNKSKVEACHEGVCCTLEYNLYTIPQKSTCTMMDYLPFLSTIFNHYYRSSAHDHYYLLAGNRTRPGVYHWSEEFCALVNCPDYGNDKQSEESSQNANSGCWHYGENDYKLHTHFRWAKLTATFSSQATVYPSAVGSKNQLIQPENQWNYWVDSSTETNKRVVIEYGKSTSDGGSLNTLGLYARIYERDPPYKRKAVKVDL